METYQKVRRTWLPFLAGALGALLLGSGVIYRVYAHHGELPNRIPEAAPYHSGEAEFNPPPFQDDWTGVNDLGSCNSCHPRVFGEWNGSMMSNAWRDPGWRGAFHLIARLTATDGNCDTPNPPDGTERAELNPFANDDCTSTWDLGTTEHTTSESGSLLDDFCSRCHMPADYLDNVPLENVTIDPENGLEHGLVDPNFDPTSDNGTGIAYATLLAQHRNTEPGKWGIFCEICHTFAETRYTPYHNYEISGTQYVPVLGTDSREDSLDPDDVDKLTPANPASANLGYTVGAGSFRLSPHAIRTPERFGPLTWNDHTSTIDPYVSDVFNIAFFYQQGEFLHDASYNVLFERAELCAACHDVTNPLTIQNQLGRWVGGFPIERTYTEWIDSRYADRPGNTNFDPTFKRDCMTCHMQQDFGNPGTALTLYENGSPEPPVVGQPCEFGPVRSVYYTHHFVGGNAYIPQLIGANVTADGDSEPAPELSVFSHSSADKKSRYSRAVYENASNTGAPTHHPRMAWERLQNVVQLQVMAPPSADAGGNVGFTVSATNAGSGHNFPSGFPEGRNAWMAVRAFDLATNTELEIHDSFWNRTSLGVGYLTTEELSDPNFPGCDFKLPPGSADPFARQFKAVASLGDGCPTLDLPYATPLNLVTNADGIPIDADGVPIDRGNPLGLPLYTDDDGDGDFFDDSFLADTRLRPLPHADATVTLTRYSVIVPPGTQGPIAVSGAMYYQPFEAVVAEKFLGNLTDTDEDLLLEPCVLKGACDGRTPSVEPAAVEGAPPTVMALRNAVININGAPADTIPPGINGTYPANGALDAYVNVVPKVFFNEPVTNLDDEAFTLADADGLTVPSFARQVGDGTWALFPNPINLNPSAEYTATVAAGICDAAGNCTTDPISWTFSTADELGNGTGDTTVPIGFGAPGANCSPDADTMCLNGGRFQVEVSWATPQGTNGQGQAVPLTTDTGYFWFFNQDNVEMLLKVMDACAMNDRFWVFAGGLTNVEVDITVTDTLSGTAKSYQNPQGMPFQPIQDTDAFATCSDGPGGLRAPRDTSWVELSQAVQSFNSALADLSPRTQASGTSLRRPNDRFNVTVAYATADGNTGTAQAVEITEDTRYFWFFNESNIELAVKVLDACSFNDRFWVFAGGLTNVEVNLTVEDIETGEVKTYQNPQQTPFQPIQDTDAFATCP